MRIHFIVQGKGGSGKSTVATLLMQHHVAADASVLGIDADPVNQSLAQFKTLPVETINVAPEGIIVPRLFDALIERLAEAPCPVVVDTGAAIFIDFLRYLDRSDTLAILTENGKEPWIHSPVTIGDLDDTLNGLKSLAATFGDAAKLVVWLNERDGPIEVDGKPFEKMKAAQAIQEDLEATVLIPQISDLHAEDLGRALRARKTLTEAIVDPSLMLMERQRLKMIQRSLAQEIGTALGPLEGVAPTTGAAKAGAKPQTVDA